jgi:hypothetical protein
MIDFKFQRSHVRIKQKIGVIHPGMPGEFHAAAEMIYQRISGFKDAPETPALEEVLKKLAHPPEK